MSGLTLSNPTRHIVSSSCQDCSCLFEYSRSSLKGQLRFFCDSCLEMRSRASHARHYQKRTHGIDLSAACLDCASIFTRVRINSRLCVNCRKVRLRAGTSRWQKSDRGRFLDNASTARRRLRMHDADSFIHRKQMQIILREPCSECGAAYSVGHSLDHKVAMCIGDYLGMDVDDWSNLRPLCPSCHAIKTSRDLRLYHALLKLDRKRSLHAV